MNPNVVIGNTSGLATHGNDLSAEPGSTSVADNVTFSRERLPEQRNGFKDYSTNLPDFSPEQLIVGSNGTDKYLFLDSGWWYHDGSNWLQKRGQLGAKATQPFFGVVVSGHLYVTTLNYTVLDINLSTGAVSTLAGLFNTSGTADGTGSAARFSTQPTGICSDGTNLYVCDHDQHTIRKIVISTGVVTTFAGTAGASGSTDASGSSARFNNPYGICTDGTNLYVTDKTNFTVRRIVISSAAVTTIAGTALTSGTADGTGAAARFNNPAGICTDNTNLYLCDLTNSTIRLLAPPLTAGAAVVTTIAGTAGSASYADGTGAAARFNLPTGIGYDGTNLYVADHNSTIRKVAPPLTAGAGIVTTPFGTDPATGFVDGIGPAARFSSPRGVIYDGTNLLIADAVNNAVRKAYLSTLYVSTIIGSANIAAAGNPSRFADSFVVGPT